MLSLTFNMYTESPCESPCEQPKSVQVRASSLYLLLSFVDHVEHEYPEKENDLRESSYVLPYLLFATALRSGILQRSLEVIPCIKDSIKASGQENWRSEAYEDHTNQAGRDMVCGLFGGGATDVMCQAVVSHSILAPSFSCVWSNRFRI